MIQMTLNMTEREAVALRTIVANISGSYDGPRGFFRKLSKALDTVGVESNRDLLERPATFRLVNEWPGENSSTPTVAIQRLT